MINSISSINFKGTIIGEAQIKNKNLKLYQILPEDKPYIDSLTKNINLRNLYSNLTEHQYELWYDTVKNGLLNTCGSNDAVLLACDNTPCGVMNYSFNNKFCDINYVATWPVKPNERVPLAGKILFTELFYKFLKSPAVIIELAALKYAPFNPIGKYLSLGFKMCGGNNFQEIMRTERSSVEKYYKILQNLINIQLFKDKKNVAFEKTLNLLK